MIVLDASAWIDVLTAGLALDELSTAVVSVPPHFDVEVLASVRGLNQRGTVSDDDATLAVSRHLRAPFHRVFDPEDGATAWDLRGSLSFADAWYVAMAIRLGSTWVTADQRAGGTATRLGVDVRIV